MAAPARHAPPGAAAGDRARPDRPGRRAAAQVSETAAEPLRSAADVFRDAQDTYARLQQLLETQPPWSRDVDAERSKCRSLHLALVFGHPLSTYAQSIDHLWLHTSYALIAAYRTAIARLETEPAAARPAPAAPRKPRGPAAPDSAHELRKTLTHLRQFLQSDETFYRGLLGRLVGFYQLQRRAAAPLAHVGVGVPAAVPGGGPEHGLSPPLGRDEAEKKVGLVYKALICLGDIERYREQYSERARKDRPDARDRKKRNGDGADDPFAKARSYYEVARSLQPDSGVAFNQLAVVDTYVHDHFAGVYHYWRAHAVSQPFPNAAANLERALKRVFERWRETRAAAPPAADAVAPPTHGDAVPEAFKRDFLVIVAILFARAGTSHLPALQDATLPTMAQLLAARQLPSEIIVKSTAMALASHWHARLQSSTQSAGDAARPPRKNVENLALLFLLNVLGVMLRVAAEQVDDALAAAQHTSALDDSASPVDDVAADAAGIEQRGINGGAPAPVSSAADDALHALAQHIPAALRRLLPALRLASRWLKANLDYLDRAARGADADVVWAAAAFWATYKRAMLGLARLFPLGQMPGLDEPLEEDADMRGFLPLKRSMTAPALAARDGDGDDDVDAGGRREVHPNEEQLMRIADLLVDVKLLMQTEAGAEALKINAPPSAYPAVPLPTQHRKTDDVASVSAETEDDPVNMAMRATLGEGSSVGDAEAADDDEVIVWTRPTAPPVEPPSPATATELHRLSLAPVQGATPATPPAVAPTPGTPQMLFGGHDGIWAMSRDESQKGASRTQAAVKALWDETPAAAGSGVAGRTAATPAIAPVGSSTPRPSEAMPSGFADQASQQAMPSYAAGPGAHGLYAGQAAQQIPSPAYSAPDARGLPQGVGSAWPYDSPLQAADGAAVPYWAQQQWGTHST